MKNMENLRLRVLETFKRLHKTRKEVFHGDQLALASARKKINEDFKNNIHAEKDKAEQLLKLAIDVEKELRVSVVQAEEKTPGRFQLNLRPEVTRLDNVPYNELADVTATKSPCCSGVKET